MTHDGRSSFMTTAIRPADPQANSEIRLLVRADDMGCSHAANMACIETHGQGIVRSVEVMATGPWFEEAAAMLRANPEVDAGVHMVLTSEWDGIKWRPLTHSPSLTDKDGYFYPLIWTDPTRPWRAALSEHSWKINEIEQEFRAQIELVRKKIPQVSHITAHMGCNDLAASVNALYEKLGKDYGLAVVPENNSALMRTPKFESGKTLEERVKGFVTMLGGLRPGTYLFLDHPGYDDPEMRAFDVSGDVAAGRFLVTGVLTSPEVEQALRSAGIHLISYRDLVPATLRDGEAQILPTGVAKPSREH